MNGLAQERITKARFPGAKELNGDGVPMRAAPPTFYLGGDGNQIIDNKIYADGKIQPVIPVGVRFATATQELRILISNPCGGQTAYPVGEYTIIFYINA